MGTAGNGVQAVSGGGGYVKGNKSWHLRDGHGICVRCVWLAFEVRGEFLMCEECSVMVFTSGVIMFSLHFFKSDKEKWHHNQVRKSASLVSFCV